MPATIRVEFRPDPALGDETLPVGFCLNHPAPPGDAYWSGHASRIGRLHLTGDIRCPHCAVTALRAGRAVLADLPTIPGARANADGFTTGGPSDLEAGLLAALSAAADDAGRDDAESLGRALAWIEAHPKDPAAVRLRSVLARLSA
jgi:hypothetical protein